MYVGGLNTYTLKIQTCISHISWISTSSSTTLESIHHLDDQYHLEEQSSQDSLREQDCLDERCTGLRLLASALSCPPPWEDIHYTPGDIPDRDRSISRQRDYGLDEQ
mmetsp:Transcript_18726/g.33903  ORF Transcript_18726/g.33903 Transcript_18726/m.33903 type:complete len:107 (-) Transcript_18726:1127-1447(-)